MSAGGLSEAGAAMPPGRPVALPGVRTSDPAPVVPDHSIIAITKGHAHAATRAGPYPMGAPFGAPEHAIRRSWVIGKAGGECLDHIAQEAHHLG